VRNKKQNMTTQILPGVIAVIGCDGSGKSTLSADLFSHLQNTNPIELLYLGQSSGNIVDWIKSLPLIGKSLANFLIKKAKGAHKKDKTSADNITVLVIYLLSLWRVHKFRRLLKMVKKHVVVITDRYPQAEISGFYFDGTGVNAGKAGSWFARKLAARELRLYQWMASHLPALIIRLNIDAATAFQRKPDHKLAMLEEKIAAIPKLHFNHAKILDLDSRNPYEQVYKQALKASQDILESAKNKAVEIEH